MRFMVATADGVQGVYLVEGDMAYGLSAADPTLGDDLTHIVTSGAAGLEQAQGARAHASAVAVSGLTPALPIRRPGKTICLGLNYADHAKEGGHEVPDYPALFMRGTSSLIPAGAPVVRPSCSERLDYEVELMVIVGRGGRHISRENALDHVFGYTVFNDVSVRDYQRKTAQWTPGKNFDATGPVGPVVVTSDELPAGAEGLQVQSRLNGNVMQSATTSNMMFKVPETLAILSEYSTLEAGDMIAMGTPEGVGHARKPPVWMRPGDTIEVSVEGIGICANPIVAEEDL
jgi:2-keto-4-pentenoate hydratase/2-oxohepta-3-ene-1,7-dioic acid hydratase in catechol pathway